MTGSEKQIAWATTIQRDWVRWFNGAIRGYRAMMATYGRTADDVVADLRAARDAYGAIDSARVIIDNRKSPMSALRLTGATAEQIARWNDAQALTPRTFTPCDTEEG